jgi:hypothetical protein
VRGTGREESPNMTSFNTGKVAYGKSCVLLSKRATKKEEKAMSVTTYSFAVLQVQSNSFSFYF